MICGDEVKAVVVDIGSNLSKLGTAGQDCPRHIFRSEIGVQQDNGAGNLHYGDSGLRFIDENLDICSMGEYSGSAISDKWDHVDKLLNHGIRDCMKVDPSEYNLFLAKNNVITDDEKGLDRILEICFESVSAPALYMCSSSALSAFSMGKQTCMVVDIGASGTTICPVIDGYELVIPKIFTSRGGNMFDRAIRKHVEETMDVGLRPWYEYNASRREAATLKLSAEAVAAEMGEGEVKQSSSMAKPAIHAKSVKTTISFRETHVMDMVRDLKHWMCFIPYVPLAFNTRKSYFSQYGDMLPPNYELPDGTTVIPSNDSICAIPEQLLFPYHPTIQVADPKTLGSPEMYIGSTRQRAQLLKSKVELWNSSVSSSINDSVSNSIDSINSSNSSSSSSSSASGLSSHGVARQACEQYLMSTEMNSYDAERDSLSDLIYASINQCDVDVRKELFQNILLVGGGSQITGLSQRLVAELGELTPSYIKPKIIPTVPCSSIEKTNAAWIGGSILSICGSFQQEWLSKWEYSEHGADRIVAQNRFVH